MNIDTRCSLPRSLSICLLLSLLLAACDAGGGATSTGTVAADPVTVSTTPVSARTPVPPTPTPGSTVQRFVTEADARVLEALPEANYGASAQLRVQGGDDPGVESYLRFMADDLTGPVREATLRLYAYTDTTDGPAVYATSNAWSEASLTWSNRPERSEEPADDAGAVRAKTWVDLDVTQLVRGEGAYSFVLAGSSSDGVYMDSREGGRPPQLLMTVDHPASAGPAPTPAPTATPRPDPVLAGAGDIAKCDKDDDEATARLLEGIPGTVFTTGDNVYDTGSEDAYEQCYGQSWGAHKSRTRPSAGDHDYDAGDGAAYFEYFGDAAGEPGKGYYSYDVGTWHVVVLNSNCKRVRCEEGSEQERWLRADLAANQTRCTLAYWHDPRFSSGEEHGDSEFVAPFWEALYDYETEIVLNGNEHNYERFAPQSPDGRPDPKRGIREFVVGTGGASHYGFENPHDRNSEVRNDDTYGVLKLTLHVEGYDWEFIPEEGKTFTDSGSDTCH